MTINDAIQYGLFGVFLWSMAQIMIGLVQPAQPRRHKRIIWESDDATKPE